MITTYNSGAKIRKENKYYAFAAEKIGFVDLKCKMAIILLAYSKEHTSTAPLGSFCCYLR